MKKCTDFIAPMSGKLLDISKVPDIVFSDRVMGDGFAIDISSSEVLAPLDGTVSVVFPGGHAICISGDNEIQILIHIGLETHGIASIYKIKVEKGQQVKQGDLLVEADYKKIRKKAKSSISPIVFLNQETVHLLKENQEVNAGENEIVEVMY
ncbi:PTS glucose transporter subunit IIA [Clostridium swellfunianum]|uniref:PTS sugar transporter subunit IIA n=1 Tax=Clostridium swellfunianum TaxID=1367462 RepID=UPI00202DB997|nr:glucose PTS transporter subunit IIA [Clostridium swellfunianum]MCM0647106.1 PTS glucose transporter subunit IIA [Clostridium swellfunianum]